MLINIELDKIKHNLLRKQLTRIASNDDTKEQIMQLISLVDEAYTEHDQERRLTERTMEVMSEELMEANQDLLKQTKELKTEKERYRLAAEAANDALWDWDLITGKVYYSPRWREMLGIPSDTPLTSIEDWYSRIYPEHLPLVKDMVEKHLTDQYKRIEVEFKIRTEDGRYIWVLARGLVSRDSHGTPIRIAGSQTNITVRKKHEAALYKAAYHDELTGLPNRALFLDRLSQVIKRELRFGEPPAAVLFVDLDRFKYINDTMGHEFGDEVLKAVAKILTNNVRPFDTVCRLGGDEFTVLLDSVENLEEAILIGQRLLKQLNRSFEIKNREVYIASSIGLTMVDRKSISAQNILRNADLAMYEAKSMGKACLEIFDTEHHQRLLNRMEMESELRKAADKGSLDIYYQPIVSLTDGKIIAFEALARWFHPVKGYISPTLFVPIAEEVGLIGQIGQNILNKVCDQVILWKKELSHRDCPRISVNLSVRQFTDERYYNQVVEKIKNYKYNEYLSLEVTESVIMTNPDLITTRLQNLKSFGVQLSIDDFGTGYSSLSYLHKYSYDTLKIDQSFIKLINCDAKSEQLTSGIIGLAKDLSLKTIAEGVESADQVLKLKELGCDCAQGFYFSKALDKKNVTQLIMTDKRFDFRELEDAS